MAKYLFVYHGGKRPEGEEETKKVMEAWNSWFQSLGPAVSDPGCPIGPSKTVSADGSISDTTTNPADGYSVIEASSIDDAAKMAKGCPILNDGGTVEIGETFSM